MTVRNNDERTGARFKPEPPPVSDTPAQTNEPAGLRFVVPTEVVDLPSRGDFYPEGHPLHNQETIEIRHMTAKEEDILTSEALLKKGLALDRLLQSVIVNKEIKVNDLLIGDKNAVTLAARISGYGEQYEVNVTCPACNATIDHTYDLSEIPHNHGIQPDDDTENVSLTPEGTFIATLPKTQFTAEFRLLNGADESSLERTATKLRKLNLPESSSTSLLKQLVVSINGVNVASEVAMFIDNMPAQDARFLRACVQLVTPNVEMTQNFECTSCGATTEMAVPFTSEFFWPN